MANDMWRAFPRLIEQNINGLLDGAMPNPAKAFMLYKTCQKEDLFTESYSRFAKHLGDFFARPRADRRKGQFDGFLARPMDQDVYENFHLNFRTATVSETALHNVANWAFNLIRVSRKTAGEAVSMAVMLKTLKYITNPPAFEKSENIDFEDFCGAWKKMVFQLFGKRHDSEMNSILNELTVFYAEQKEADLQALTSGRSSAFNFTDVETEWLFAVREAAFELEDIPKFPLSTGPQKQILKDLDRVISLYRVVQTTKLPELIKHRGNIRSTILDRCDRLLPREAKAA